VTPGQYHPDFDWTEENGVIRAGLLGLLSHPEMDAPAARRLTEIVEDIVSEMDSDSKLVFRRRVIEAVLRGEDPPQFQIRRGPSGRYELALDPAPDAGER